MTARLPGLDASNLSSRANDEVVHIDLLLPANRAQALIAMSQRRRESVGQILRGLIDSAIAKED